jgi:hypothetical protein
MITEQFYKFALQAKGLVENLSTRVIDNTLVVKLFMQKDYDKCNDCIEDLFQCFIDLSCTELAYHNISYSKINIQFWNICLYSEANIEVNEKSVEVNLHRGDHVNVRYMHAY